MEHDPIYFFLHWTCLAYTMSLVTWFVGIECDAMLLSKEALKTIPSIKTNCSCEVKTIKWKKKDTKFFEKDIKLARFCVKRINIYLWKEQ